MHKVTWCIHKFVIIWVNFHVFLQGQYPYGGEDTWLSGGQGNNAAIPYSPQTTQAFPVSHNNNAYYNLQQVRKNQFS